MSKPTRAEALASIREHVGNAMGKAHAEATIAAIGIPEALSEEDAAMALVDAFVFSTCDERGWLPTNEEAARSIYAAGLAIVRVRP